MVDKVSFLETDSNQTYLNSIVLCENHKYKCKTFKLDSENHNSIFKCHTCMIQEKQDYSLTVPLSQVCSSNNSTIILSWPPLEDQTLLQKAFQISNQQHSKQTECDKIVDFFDQFTNQILQKINEKKKSILSQAENIVDSSQQIQQVYQQIANLQELKEIIQNDKMNYQQKSQSISKIIQKKNSEKFHNTQLINQCLEAQNTPKIFDFHVLDQFKFNLISQVELLDYQNQILIKDFNSFIQQFLLVQNSFNIPHQTTSHIEIQKDSNLDRIIKLISNKSNSCSEKYIDSVKLELNKLSIMINNLNIEREVFLPNKQQVSIDFNNLESDQIENIQILTEKMKIINHQYNQINHNSNMDELSSQLQPSSFFVMEKIFNLQQLMTQQKIRNIEKLLRKYPIFEVEQIIKPMKYDYKIELSKLNDSQTKGKVSFDNDGFSSFEVMRDNWTTSYIRINQDFKYRIRIKMHFTNKENRQFYIGLVKDQEKDNCWIANNSFVPDLNQGDRGVSKVIKGKCLREVKYPEEYSEIEVRVCVRERLFEVSDYPKRENINTINDDRINKIDLNSVYLIGLQIYRLGDKITILEFEEENIQNENDT